MAKYLHLFETANEFMDQYYDSATSTTTSITTTTGLFVYDGYRLIETTGGRMEEHHTWMKGENEADRWTWERNPEISGSAYKPGYNAWEEISSVGTIEKEPGYQEPWVSYTEENSAVTYNKQIWLDLTGEPYPSSVNPETGITNEPNYWPGEPGDTVLVKEPNGEVKEYITPNGIQTYETNSGPSTSVQYERDLTNEEINIYGCHAFVLNKYFVQAWEGGTPGPLRWSMAFRD